MAAPDRAACLRLPSAGLQMAGPGPPGAFHRDGRPGEFGSASSPELFVCLGNESPPNCGRNPIIGRTLERTFRGMKKTLLTILQLAVTGALLYWVFHDPAVRAAMATAIREADIRWIAAAIVMYVIVEFAAGFRWAVLPQVTGINLRNRRGHPPFFF